MNPLHKGASFDNGLSMDLDVSLFEYRLQGKYWKSSTTKSFYKPKITAQNESSYHSHMETDCEIDLESSVIRPYPYTTQWALTLTLLWNAYNKILDFQQVNTSLFGVVSNAFLFFLLYYSESSYAPMVSLPGNTSPILLIFQVNPSSMLNDKNIIKFCLTPGDL